MDTIHYLQNQFNAAQAILEQYERKYKDDPQNFAVELSLLSMREHIKDLQEQIRLEQKAFFNSDIAFPKTWIDKRKDAHELELQLKRTDENAPHVIEVQGLGGSGKSCFMRRFLDELEQRKLEYEIKIWFSFYKLRSTIDPFAHFLDFTLERLDHHYRQYKHQGTEKKRSQLEEILRSKKIFVILDGLEIAQHDTRNKYGSMKAPELKKFLYAACNFPESQLVVTTRLPLSDLSDKKGFHQFKMENWTFSDIYYFMQRGGVKGNEEEIRKVIKALGFHPLTLTAFRFLLIEYYGGDIKESFRIVEVIRNTIKQANKNKIAYQKQLDKLKIIIRNLWSHLDDQERLFMKRLSALYGEVSEDTYQLLTEGDPFSPEFREIISRFKNASLIIGGIREGKPTITAHPMIKQSFYDLMDETEKQRTHMILADFFQNRPKPESPRVLSDLDDLVEWFQQCIRGNLFRTAYDIMLKPTIKKRSIFQTISGTDS